MSGFVVIRREALDHHIIGDPARFYAWCWLISTACWKPTKYNIQGKTITLERGQLCASRSQMAEAWGWSPSAVERFLTRLKTEQMIGRATGQGRSIITICNYAKYQDVPERNRTASGQATGQPPDSHRTAKEPYNQETSVSNETHKRAWACPDWVEDEQVWKDFLANRKRKRLPNTPTAWKGFQDDLARLASAEWPPWSLLQHATRKGWGAIYLPQDDRNPKNETRDDKRDGAARALDRRLGFGEPTGPSGQHADRAAPGDYPRAIAGPAAR